MVLSYVCKINDNYTWKSLTISVTISIMCEDAQSAGTLSLDSEDGVLRCPKLLGVKKPFDPGLPRDLDFATFDLESSHPDIQKYLKSESKNRLPDNSIWYDYILGKIFWVRLGAPLYFGYIWGICWVHFGYISVVCAPLHFGYIWRKFGVHLGYIWGTFGVNLGHIWVHFGSISTATFWIHFDYILGTFW